MRPHLPHDLPQLVPLFHSSIVLFFVSGLVIRACVRENSLEAPRVRSQIIRTLASPRRNYVAYS